MFFFLIFLFKLNKSFHYLVQIYNPDHDLKTYRYLFFFQGSKGHFGTYQSIIYGLASEREGNLKKLRAQLYSKPMPKFGPKLARR